MFQLTIGQRTEVITPGALRDMPFRLCASLPDKHPPLASIRFTPHDFRRLFATDLANHGLPILGQCGRPYSAPGDHEHACIRCPTLRVDPKMIDRLDEIHTYLIAAASTRKTNEGSAKSTASTLQCVSAEKRGETLRLARFSNETVTAIDMPTIGAPA